MQAQNGTNSDSDKSSIQDEIKSRLDEIDRVSQQTQFNGVNVLAKDGNMKIQVGANDGQTISIDLKKIDSNTLKLDNFNVTNMATTVKNGSTGNVQIAVTSAVSDDDNAAPETVTSLAKNSNGDYFATTSSGTYAATVDNKTGTISFDSSGTSLSPTGTTAVTTIGKDVTLDTTAVDAANKSLVTYKDEAGNDNYLVQTTDANGDSTYEAATINATTGAVTAGASVATPANFNANPLAKLDSAIADIDKFRSSLGAVQNRLNSAVTNLSNTTTNLTAAQSRIQDADYATEVSNMSKAQIVQQAGNSVLAKANQVPQQVLSLLQG